MLRRIILSLVVLGALFLGATNTSAQDPYPWDHPNTNPYRGTLEFALAQSGWPPHVQEAIIRDRSHCSYDEIPLGFQFEWMMFGAGPKAHVKRNVVANAWHPRFSRRVLVCRYEDRVTMREYVFFVPDVCNNASGYSRPVLVCICPPEVKVCAKK